MTLTLFAPPCPSVSPCPPCCSLCRSPESKQAAGDCDANCMPRAIRAAQRGGMRVDLLRELCETPGVPGREERLRAVVRRELAPLADDIRVDAMGNLIARKRGGGAGKLMI